MKASCFAILSLLVVDVASAQIDRIGPKPIAITDPAKLNGMIVNVELLEYAEKGERAVGRACGKNPIPIVIPCHRVLAKGGMGGYSGEGGLLTKQRLLALEGTLMSSP